MNYLSLIKKSLEAEKIALEKSLDEAEMCRREAPSVMESASDTARARYEQLITSFNEKLILIKKQISLIPKNLPSGPMWNCYEKYILVPEGFGGRKIGEKFLVSSDTPIGRKLLNDATINDSGHRPE